MHHALVHEGLQPMQQGLTGGMVACHRLLLEQGVETGRAAIREACPEHLNLNSGRGVAQCGGVGQHEPCKFFSRRARVQVARSMVRNWVRIPTAPR